MPLVILLLSLLLSRRNGVELHPRGYAAVKTVKFPSEAKDRLDRNRGIEGKFGDVLGLWEMPCVPICVAFPSMVGDRYWGGPAKNCTI
jgi:hypothetical protein